MLQETEYTRFSKDHPEPCIWSPVSQVCQTLLEMFFCFGNVLRCGTSSSATVPVCTELIEHTFVFELMLSSNYNIKEKFISIQGHLFIFFLSNKGVFTIYELVFYFCLFLHGHFLIWNNLDLIITISINILYKNINLFNNEPTGYLDSM